MTHQPLDSAHGDRPFAGESGIVISNTVVSSFSVLAPTVREGPSGIRPQHFSFPLPNGRG